ncbi:MAG: hypothetical protein LWX11_08415, partial [Firmicutes bacterium]|nr:hypothetical protein [Bacillota bacterium]
VADLRVAEGDWKNALALYPAQPRQSQRGWVALMRATCQIRLGQKEAARATLQAAKDEASFKAERERLAADVK